MTKHPTTPKIPEDPEDMKAWAKSFSNMQYDKLYDFLSWLSEDIMDDAEADKKRGRKILSLQLYYLGVTLKKASLISSKVWDICKPFM